MGLSRQDPEDYFVSPSFDPLLRPCCTLFPPEMASLTGFSPCASLQGLPVAATFACVLDTLHMRLFPLTGPQEGSIYTLHRGSETRCPGTRTNFIFRHRLALNRPDHV
jgi:hypothetical protein